MSWSRVRAHLGAIALAGLPAVLAVGVVAMPAADATVGPAGVTLTLGPGQNATVAKVVTTPSTGVTPVATCDSGLTVTFDPDLVGTVWVAAGADADSYACSIDYQVSGQSFGLIETVTVNVPGVSVGGVTVTEGNSGTVPATFTVSMSQPSTDPVTVDYATADGSATGLDYADTTGTVTFAAGQTSQTVTVPVDGDTVDEPDEAFSVNLSGAVGAAITSGHGVGTILDDDRNGVFSCRASVLNLLGVEPVVANDPGTPCADDHHTVAPPPLTVGDVTVGVTGFDAVTDQSPDTLAGTTPADGDSGSASATLSTVTITGPDSTTTLTVMTATAVATCVSTSTGLAPQFSGTSSIVELAVDGTPVATNSAPADIDLGYGVLHLNNTIRTANSLIQRAVWLHTAFGDVMVAEAMVGVAGTDAHPSGNPCVTR